MLLRMISDWSAANLCSRTWQSIREFALLVLWMWLHFSVDVLMANQVCWRQLSS
ncbi:hypothetical protein M3J09_005392 [Ascochyta lentis]